VLRLIAHMLAKAMRNLDDAAHRPAVLPAVTGDLQTVAARESKFAMIRHSA
jgi:hypothetical protein